MDSGVMPEILKGELDAVYRDYRTAAQMPTVTLSQREDMARSSAAVAIACRDMAAVPGLDWWAYLALLTTAEAFEFQAQDWRVPRPRPVAPHGIPSGAHSSGVRRPRVVAIAGRGGAEYPENETDA